MKVNSLREIIQDKIDKIDRYGSSLTNINHKWTKHERKLYQMAVRELKELLNICIENHI